MTPHTPTATEPFASTDDRRRLMRELESDAEHYARVEGVSHEFATVMACARWLEIGLAVTRELRDAQVTSVADDLLEMAREKDAQRGRRE